MGAWVLEILSARSPDKTLKKKKNLIHNYTNNKIKTNVKVSLYREIIINLGGRAEVTKNKCED